MHILRYASLYGRFFSQTVKSMMAYRLDFLLGIAVNLVRNVVGLLFLSVIFTRIPELNGWTIYEIAFVYGLVSIPAGLAEIFLNAPWNIPWHYIYPGGLDVVLIRPINVLFHTNADQVGLHGLGHVVVGVALVIAASLHLSLVWSVANLLFLILVLISGTFIYFSINLIVSTFSFWFVNVVPIMTFIHRMSDFGRYPISIYPKALQVFFTWLIPYAFVGFYPSTALLSKDVVPVLSWASPIVAAALLFVAYRWWLFGLRHYQSTGS